MNSSVIPSRIIEGIRVSCAVRPASGSYQCSYYLRFRGKQSRRYTTGKTPEEAFKKAKAAIVRYQAGVDAKKADKVTVAGLSVDYLHLKEHREKRARATVNNIRIAFQRINPLIGHIKLTDLTREDVDECIDDLQEDDDNPLEDSTIKVYMGQLIAAIEFAIDRGDLKENVAKRATLPDVAEHDMHIPDELTMASILAAQETLTTGDNLVHSVLCRYLARTGVRITEALRLHVDHIDRERMTIRIPRSSTKTRAGARTIGIEQADLDLLDLLADRRERSGGQVFAQLDGSVVCSGYVRARLKLVGEKLGLEGLKPHLFRHYHASQILNNGGDMYKVMARLGHKNIQTTLKIYGHLKHQVAMQEVSQVNDRLERMLALLRSQAPVQQNAASLPEPAELAAV